MEQRIKKQEIAKIYKALEMKTGLKIIKINCQVK